MLLPVTKTSLNKITLAKFSCWNKHLSKNNRKFEAVIPLIKPIRMTKKTSKDTLNRCPNKMRAQNPPCVLKGGKKTNMRILREPCVCKSNNREQTQQRKDRPNHVLRVFVLCEVFKGWTRKQHTHTHTHAYIHGSGLRALSRG